MKVTALMEPRIKKPEYLGNSMWDVSYNSKIIQVKMMDLEWLYEFQNRKKISSLATQYLLMRRL